MTTSTRCDPWQTASQLFHGTLRPLKDVFFHEIWFASRSFDRGFSGWLSRLKTAMSSVRFGSNCSDRADSHVFVQSFSGRLLVIGGCHAKSCLQLPAELLTEHTVVLNRGIHSKVGDWIPHKDSLFIVETLGKEHTELICFSRVKFPYAATLSLLLPIR